MDGSVVIHVANGKPRKEEPEGVIHMDRKLVTIQEITDLQPIEKADAIEVATILGWNVVVKKGEFKVGDKCIYFEIDSLLPELPVFEFLRAHWNERMQGFRLKTIKLRGQISQGLALPLSALKDILQIGADLTLATGVQKYEAFISPQLAGTMKGSFPSNIPKTDEERVQNIKSAIQLYGETPWLQGLVNFYITEKLDGSSMTAYVFNSEFGVCSRNIDLKETEDNSFWKMARKLDLEKILRTVTGPMAIQGELVGPGIQGNKYNLSEQQFFVFNIYDMAEGKYFSWDFVRRFCLMHDLATVPDLTAELEYFHEREFNVPNIIKMCAGASDINPLTPREGVVFRTDNPLETKRIVVDQQRYGRFSFKAISPEFLLKYGE